MVGELVGLPVVVEGVVGLREVVGEVVVGAVVGLCEGKEVSPGKLGALVGALVGAEVGALVVGAVVGALVGAEVGALVGLSVVGEVVGD